MSAANGAGRDTFVCSSCGAPSQVAARMYCTECRGYHEICLGCASRLDLSEEPVDLMEQILALRGRPLEPDQGLVLLSVGGAGAFCGPSARDGHL